MAACSSTPSAELVAQPAAEVVNASGATATIDRHTYDNAFSAFQRCMEAAGAPIFDVRDEYGQWLFGYATNDKAAYDECYGPFSTVDREWQIANEYQNPTQVALRACLRASGVEPAATVAGVWEQIQQNDIDPVACTTR